MHDAFDWFIDFCFLALGWQLRVFVEWMREVDHYWRYGDRQCSIPPPRTERNFWAPRTHRDFWGDTDGADTGREVRPQTRADD